MTARSSPVGPTRIAIIIGAMKAGTTSLFQYLSAHPSVAPSSPKEPDFFTDPGWWDDGVDADERMAAYLQLWDWDPAVHEIALEASTSYTMRPAGESVPERVKALGDLEFRFIYIMRDPVRRMESHLSHLATRRGRSDRIGEEDMERAIQVSRYASRLDRWAEQWPRSRILPLVYEELVDAPAAVVARVLSFLEVSDREFDREVLDRTLNARSDLAADQLLSRVLEAAPWLEPLRRVVPERMVTGVRAVAGRWASRSVTLTPEQEARALAVLRPEAVRVRQEWGVDTSAWESVS